MSTDPTTSTSSPAPPARRPRRRLHPLVIGLLSTVVSLAAGALAALAYVAVVDEPAAASRPEPEFELRLTPADADPPPESEASGEALPDTPFPLLGGGETSFAAYRGKPLVVNVWASTCAPCLTEMPDLQQVSEEHAGHLEFLGLAFLDDPVASQAMVDETGVRYDIGLDPDGAIGAEIGTVGLPFTLFVDADGTVVDTKVGAMPLDEIRRRVEDLLG
jgi:cytochrome c biogenesis protein CcmG, thiol:disulfide interchange protein DsbE